MYAQNASPLICSPEEQLSLNICLAFLSSGLNKRIPASILASIKSLSKNNDPSAYIFLSVLNSLHANDLDTAKSSINANLAFFSGNSPRFFYLSCLYDLISNDLSALHRKIFSNNSFPEAQSLEFRTLKVQYWIRRSMYGEALDELLYICRRFPSSREHRVLLLISCVEARSHRHTIPELRRAIADFGLHPDFNEHFCRISLLKHRSADARKYVLKSRIAHLTRHKSSPPFLSNYWVTQDRLGYSDWLRYLQADDFDITSLPLPMLEPLIAQFASIDDSKQQSIRFIDKVLSSFPKPQFSPFSKLSQEYKSEKVDNCLD